MDPPELIFLKNLDPRNLFFRKKVEIYGPPMKRLDPRGTYFSKDSWKIWTPWNLFFKRQLKNMDPMELEIWNPFGLVTWELVRTNLYIANLNVKRNSTNWVKKVKKILWMYLNWKTFGAIPLTGCSNFVRSTLSQTSWNHILQMSHWIKSPSWLSWLCTWLQVRWHLHNTSMGLVATNRCHKFYKNFA